MNRPLSVLTLNCWNVSSPYEERMALLREGIEALQPDLIGLQEIIVRPDGFSQARHVLDDLGYEIVFGPAFAWDENHDYAVPEGRDFGFGNVAAARLPIVDRDWIRLPGSTSGEIRSATAIVVSTPDGEVPFVSTHLNWKFDHGNVREQQVVALRDFAWRVAGDRYLPPIIVGDFNADPDSAEIRFLRGWQSLEGKSAFFEDAWSAAGDGGPGLTWDNRNPFAHLVHEPDRRIDYIFVGFDHDRGRVNVEDCRIVMNEARNGVYPSDHFGLMAWLVW